ncbi:putative bifunctional diguanylate cyclase/phosphodiesterase [Crenalkalicoccus roseus]|uniref:putative bifunctional diguanylate cyclase/phosphodiesterase n=1 Tax=Crenalkalicoccus roseus TaxID=1485588 RepID=UPI00108226B6|nr:EAL domain-containing protein [Crenalkalicoccus roseus]
MQASPEVPAPGRQRHAVPELGRSLRTVERALIAIALILAIASLGTTALLFGHRDGLRAATRYNDIWAVSQAAQEVARLQIALGGYAIGRGAAERDAVELWLDIVENRSRVLNRGELALYVSGLPELAAAVERLQAAIAEARTLTDRLEEPGVAEALMRRFGQLAPELARLAAAAYVQGTAAVAADIRHLAALHWVLSAALFALILCCLAMVVLLRRRHALLREAYGGMQALVRDLERAGTQLEEANARVRAAMEEVQQQNLALQARDAELHIQNARFDAALNNMSQGLCMVDAEERLIVCNQRFRELFGLQAERTLPGTPALEAFSAASPGGQVSPKLAHAIWADQALLAAGGRPATFVREDENGRTLMVLHQPMASGGWVATYEDITERRQAERRITYMAHHDALTGLPNRVMFQQRAEDTLRRLHPDTGGLALLCLDIDGFKDVNDSLGHPAGDALLQAVAGRLRGLVNEGDLVARLGGDEFAVLQVARSQPAEAEALAQFLIARLSEPYALDAGRISIGVSVGLSVAGEAASSVHHLLRNADLALHRAKAEGRRSWCRFMPGMEEALRARLDTEADLRSALSGNEFEILYQPVFDLRAGRPAGFEALLRWHHGRRGLVPPSEFVPVAEQSGLIIPIGRWVLQQACLEAAGWPAPLKVAVNLSPVQFRSGDLVRTVREALALSGLAPGRLELEITETTLLQDNEAVLGMLQELRALGIRVALDDFGTRYSSLSYLRAFPFDKIKIDQSFVRDMSNRADCLTIVRSVARLAAQLGMTATAEGVETAEQRAQVEAAGCTEAQGYLFGRPEPAGTLERWFRDLRHPRPALVDLGGRR